MDKATTNTKDTGDKTYKKANANTNRLAIPTSIGAIFGAQAGARIAKRLKAKSILALMSVAVFALAVRLILKSGILG